MMTAAWRDRYPDLYQFFGAWFHQDWTLEAAGRPSTVDVVDRFLRASDPAAARRVIAALQRFLSEPISDVEVTSIVRHEFGSEYDAARVPVPADRRQPTTRVWLEQILLLLTAGRP